MRGFSVLFFFLIANSLLAQRSVQADSVKADTYHRAFEKYIHTEPQEAQTYLDSLEILSRTSDYKIASLLYHKDLAYSQFNRHDMQASKGNYAKALEIAENLNSEKEVLSCKTWLANHAYFENENETAFELFTEVFERAVPLGYIDDASSALFGLASVEEDNEKALKYLLRIDSLHQAHDKVSANLSNAYGAIGNMYLKSYGNKELARSYFELAYQAAVESNYVPGMDEMAILLGELAFESEDYETSRRYYTNELGQWLEKGDSIRIAHVLTKLAQVDLAEKSPSAALSRLEEALSIYERLKDSVSMTKTHMNLGYAHLQNNDAGRANDHINYARTFPNVLAGQDYEVKLSELVIAYHEKTGNFRAALEEQKVLDRLREQRAEEQNNEAFLEMEQKYRANQKEQELQLLRSEQALADERSKNQLRALVAGLVLVSLVGLFFFFQYRQRQRTNQKLRELDRAKSTFFQNISHEFRTPLTLIKGPIEHQLSDAELTSSDRRELILVQRNASRLENLVEQLMALSKLESGHWKLRVRPGNLRSFIHTQAEAFSQLAMDKGIQFQLEIEDDEGISWFDPDALEKVLFNLLGNAMKFTPEEGTIQVKGAADKGHYSLLVSNSGSYIPEDAQQKIFERFYQTHHTQPGTGIGLALTRELVELHKGNIAVESKEGGTTNFSIDFPINRAAYTDTEVLSEALQEVFAPQKKEVEESLEAIAPLSEDAPLLLIVDDNPEIVTYVSTLLSDAFRIITATDVSSGLAQALEHVPDVIISDVMMPGADGFEFTRTLKEHEITAHIPIVLLTAKSEEQDRLTGLRIGADSYLPKPFSTSVLRATVTNLLDNRKKVQGRYAQEIILKPREIAVSSADERFLERLEKVLDEYLVSPQFSASRFSEEMGVSRMQLHRKLKGLTGLSTTEFLRSQRVKLAARLLKKGNISIAEVGYSVGFNDPSYFTKCFRNEFGSSPSEYMK